MDFKLALIGGSGIYNLDRAYWGKKLKTKIISTPFGDSAPIHVYLWKNELPYVLLSRHVENSYRTTAPFINYRANIWALKEIGIERILSWSGPGAINAAYHPGDYVVADDLLDFTKNRPNTFYTNGRVGFIRQNPVFCPQVGKSLIDTLKAERLSYHQGGAYACTQGPRLETPAEIRMLKILGADMVGMTVVPEVFLAKELEMCYGVLCYITNYAEGVKIMPYKKGVLFEGTLKEKHEDLVDKALSNMGYIAPLVLRKLAGMPRDCPCKDSMLRYKLRGDIDDDFRKWII